MRIRAAAVMAAMVAVLALAAACGGDDADDEAAATPDASGMVEVAVRNVTFVPDRIVVPAGQKVTLVLKNEDAQEHDLQVSGIEVQVIEGGATGAEHQMDTPMDGMETPMMMETPAHGEGQPSGEMGPVAIHATANGEASITFVASEKGTYDFWCTLSGHKDQGMVGQLIVE